MYVTNTGKQVFAGLFVLFLFGFGVAAYGQSLQTAGVEITIEPDSFNNVSPGDSVEMLVTFEPVLGVHLNADPSPRITVEGTVAMLSETVFSGPKRLDKNLGISIFDGKTVATVKLDISSSAEAGEHNLKGNITYFPCNDNTGSCFMLNKGFSIPLVIGSSSVAEKKEEGNKSFSGWVERKIHNAFGGSPIVLFFLVFLGGVLSSLTPCVYPMIPITVSFFGGNSEDSRLKVFIKALVYLLGIAIVYAIFGVAAAATGKAFGSLTQKPAVLFFVGIVLYLMGLSMMGLFEIRLPELSGGTKRREGITGAFLLGAMSGLIASPCLTPILAALLAYVAKTGSIIYGFFILFVFALGLGMLLVVIAVFSSFASKLPKAGGWMNGVKIFLGIALAGVGCYFLGQTSILLGMAEETAYTVGGGIVAVFAGFLMRPFSIFREEEPDDGALLKKAIALLLIVSGCFLVVYGISSLLPGNESVSVARAEIIESEPYNWIKDDYERAFSLAKTENKPLIIDFWAEWCVYCKKLEKITFRDSKVVGRAGDFVFLKVNYDNNRELASKFDVSGLPTVLFLEPGGREVSRETSYFGADTMLRNMDKVLE